MHSIRRRRMSLFWLFFMPGLGLASWITRTPALRDHMDLSIGEMGLFLLALSVGSTMGLVASGPAVNRFGTKPLLVLGVTIMLAGIPVLGVGAQLGIVWLAAAGLLCFGAGMGTADISMNVEGANLERDIGRPTIPALHGAMSIGSVVGALTGMVATFAGVPVFLHLVVIAVVRAPILIWALIGIAAVRPQTETAATSKAEASLNSTARKRSVWRDPRLVLIGFTVFALALSEGAANDWLPILMVDAHSVPETSSAFVYLVFSISVGIGRFSGGWFISRFGNAHVLATSAAIGAIGLGTVIITDNFVLAAIGVVLWGIGTSLGFPIAISAAGESGDDPARRVTVVATLGYIAFLAGPPLLGLAGENWGLRSALIIVLVGIILAIFLTPALRPAKRREEAKQSVEHVAK